MYKLWGSVNSIQYSAPYIHHSHVNFFPSMPLIDMLMTDQYDNFSRRGKTAAEESIAFLRSNGKTDVWNKLKVASGAFKQDISSCQWKKLLFAGLLPFI